MKHNIMSKKGLEAYFGILFQIRKLIIMVVSHFVDISSDIAVALEWYHLSQKQLQNNDHDNEAMYVKKDEMKTLFWCCISVMIYYRVTSAYKVYIFSHSKMDAFLQFIFDFYLLKLIYVNIAKMHSYTPLDIVQIYRAIEGSHESGYQAILTMVFLIRTNFTSISSITSLVSLIFSLWSLSSRFINADKYFLNKNASTHGIKWKDIKRNGIWFVFRQRLKFWYFYHILFRTLEVTFSIILLSLIWTQFGAVVFGIVLVMLAICVILVNIVSNSNHG